MGTEQAGPEPERKFAITRGGVSCWRQDGEEKLHRDREVATETQRESKGTSGRPQPITLP